PSVVSPAMPLSQKHRSTIYQKLEPILGEEEAEALLSQFPAGELDEPVTKEFVRAEFAELRAEFAELRVEMHAELAQLRVEMHQLARRTFFSFSAVTIAAMGLEVALSRFA